MFHCNEAIIGAIIQFCTTSCFLPFSCFTLKNQYDKVSSAVDKTHMWSEMLPEILEDISDRLPLRDFVAFRCVCRKWRSAPSGRSEITSFSKKRPWLMFYEFDRKSGVAEDTCYLYNRPHPNCCAIRLPHLRGARVMHSKAGWLFARSGDGHFFIYHPLTLTKIDLPKHIVAEEQVCTMTSPTAPNNCIVFIISRRTDSALEISWCRVGDTEWKNHTEEISKGRIGTMIAAYGCDDSHNREACAVQREKSSIHIRGSKRCLVYDYMNKRCVKEWTAKSRARPGKVKFWDEDLKSPVHHKKWLERFGEKGISISTCALSMRSEGSIGISGGCRVVAGCISGGCRVVAGCISGGCRVVAGESQSTVEHKLVRASWIHPN